MSHFLFALFCLFAFTQVILIESHAGHDHDHDHDEEEEENENSDVVVLTDADIEKTIADNEFVFIEFYAPWCGHCKRLEPDYEIVATNFKDSGVVIAKVDVTANPLTGEKFAIRGFPTLKLFRKGVPLDYDSARTAIEITQWIKKKTGPPSLHITEAEKLSSLLVQTETKVIAYLTDDQLPTWTALATSGKMDEFVLAHVTDAALHSHKAGTVVIAKAGDEDLVFSGAFEEEELTKWILGEAYPLVDELAQKIWLRSSSSGTPLLAVFVSALDDATTAMIRDIATPLKGRVLTSQSTTANLAERWGTSGKKFPTAILVKWKESEPKMVVFNEETETFSVETCLAFVEAALKDSYTGYKKSEPIPESNDGPVTVLVGKTFEQIVFDKEKDVFVEFYAPWCGHCKNLAPIWDELGESFKDVQTVVIAKIDATANTLPDNIEIQGFPTLIFYPADNKVTGVPFNGDRDLKSMTKFVSDHASRSVEKEEL